MEAKFFLSNGFMTGDIFKYFWFSLQLQDVLQNGEVPEKPEHCPSSLYKLMTVCWKRDKVSRPDISDVLKYLKELYVLALISLPYCFEINSFKSI